MKLLLCQISLSALLFAQSPTDDAKRKAMCDAMSRAHTYLDDDAAHSYLQSLVNQMGSGTVRIVDQAEPWADYLPCRVVLVTKGFLQRATTERELADTIAHMFAHAEQDLIATTGRIPLYFKAHQTLLAPKALVPRVEQAEADATRRAEDLLAAVSADTNSTGLKTFQERYPASVQKKPTLYRNQ